MGVLVLLLQSFVLDKTHKCVYLGVFAMPIINIAKRISLCYGAINVCFLVIHLDRKGGRFLIWRLRKFLLRGMCDFNKMCFLFAQEVVDTFPTTSSLLQVVCDWEFEHIIFGPGSTSLQPISRDRGRATLRPTTSLTLSCNPPHQHP